MHGAITNGVVVLLCVAVASCSALIRTGERQCKQDLDCVAAKLGTDCVDQVCIATSECVGTACPAVSGAGQQGPCATDKDCIEEAAPRCLSQHCVNKETAERWVCTADEQTIRSATVRYGFHIVDFLSRQPPADVIVNACRINDVECAEPVATFTDTDKTGHAQFDLPSGFLGFFEVHSASLPTLLYVTKPIIKNTLNRDLPVLTPAAMQLLVNLSGYPFDMAKGLVLLEALDCSDTPAGGIQFDVVGSTADRFYIVDQIPSHDVMLTEYDETNNSADGGFINVGPGFVTFSARLGSDGLELGTFNARIRANTITFIDMHF